MNRQFARLLALAALSAAPVFAQDHPLFTAFPGSKLEDIKVKEFDEYAFPEGQIMRSAYVKSENLEGKLTSLKYDNPPQRSTLELMRNYEASLKKSGFDTIFSCKGRQCGEGCITDKGLGWHCAYDEHRSLYAKLPRRTGDIYMAVYVSENETHVAVLEKKGMDDNSSAGTAPAASAPSASSSDSSPAEAPAPAPKKRGPSGTGPLTSGIVKGLGTFGFHAKLGSADNASADIIVEGTVETNPLEGDADKRWKWARSNATINLKDGHTGKTFLRFEASDRQASADSNEAMRRSQVELGKKVADLVRQGITDYFENQ